MRVIRAQDVQPEPHRQWLVEPYVPAAELTLVTGARRSGKGLLCVALAAAATQGERVPWDLAPGEPLAQHSCFWVVSARGSEDSPVEITARCAATDVDLARFQIVELAPGEGATELQPLLTGPGPKLVVIDPLQAVVGDLSHPGARSRMEELVAIARSTNSTIVAIRHPTADGRRARGRGEIADVARSEVYIGRHPEDADLVVVAQAPSSYGEAFPVAFRIDPVGGSAVLRYVDDDFDDDLHVNDLLPRPPRRRTTARLSPRVKIERFLRELLADGPQPRSEVMRLAKRHRLRERTVDAVARRIGLVRREVRQSGQFGGSIWSLRPEPPARELPTVLPPQGPPPLRLVPDSPSASEGAQAQPEEPELVDPGIIRFRLLDLSDDKPRATGTDPPDPSVERFRRLQID